MKINRGPIEMLKGPSDQFTGDVYIDTVAANPGPSGLQASNVHCSPGARSAWHAHPLGETIFVTEGVGLVQREGGLIKEVRPGDSVYFEAGERHWQGAAGDRFVVYTAIEEAGADAAPVLWGEHVSDDEYAGRAAPAPLRAAVAA